MRRTLLAAAALLAVAACDKAKHGHDVRMVRGDFRHEWLCQTFATQGDTKGMQEANCPPAPHKKKDPSHAS